MVMSCVLDIITVDLCSLEDALYMLLLTAVFRILSPGKDFSSFMLLFIYF